MDVEEHVSMHGFVSQKQVLQLRFSRQECISDRLPNIKNLQPVTSALPRNVNFEPRAERFYILLSLPHLHLLLFLSVTTVILSSPFHSSRGALCCFWLTITAAGRQGRGQHQFMHRASSRGGLTGCRRSVVLLDTASCLLSQTWFLYKHPVPHQTLSTFGSYSAPFWEICYTQSPVLLY